MSDIFALLLACSSYTELKIDVPESGLVGLHADNMTIERILVDGQLAEFEFFPHYQNVDNERRWLSVLCTSSASDAACSTYISSLDKEMSPNLLILCRKSVKSTPDQQCRTNMENNLEDSSGEAKKDFSGSNGHAVDEVIVLGLSFYCFGVIHTWVFSFGVIRCCEGVHTSVVSHVG